MFIIEIKNQILNYYYYLTYFNIIFTIYNIFPYRKMNAIHVEFSVSIVLNYISS